MQLKVSTENVAQPLGLALDRLALDSRILYCVPFAFICAHLRFQSRSIT